MGKFRFESLLKIREATRDEIKSAFLDVENQRRKASDELAKLNQEIVNEREISRRSRKNAEILKDDLRLSQERRDKLSVKRKQALTILESLDEELEKKRQELNAAIKEVKILQNLRDKTEEREIEEAKRLTTKAIDELTSQQKAYELHQMEDEKEE
jgi:flagellar FliJ protein